LIAWLVPWLAGIWSPFQALRYITVRAVLAAAFAFLLALVVGRPLIARLKRAGVRENVSDCDSPEVGRLALRDGKHEVPTMGGVFWSTAILVSTLIFARPDEILVLLGAILLVGMGTLGFLDDWIKWKKDGGRNGLSRTTKLVATLLLSGFVTAMLWNLGVQSGRPEISRIYVPVFKNLVAAPDGLGMLGLLVFLVFEAFVILASTHAVNVTDGLDGLAAGSGLIAFSALTLAAYAAGNVQWAAYLHTPFIPGAGEVAVMGGAILGATLGFLWFNCHPAQVFLGDSGSLPMGALLAYLAIVSKQELVLPLLAGVFVVECGSSLLQILWFKATRGRRLFSIAPMHHVFQFRGMPEEKIVTRFWIFGAVSATLGLLLLKVR